MRATNVDLKLRKGYAWIALFLLVLAALACNPLSGAGGSAAPTPTLFEIPTQPESSTGGGSTAGGTTGGSTAGGGGGLAQAFSDPANANLSSYRSKFSFHLTGTNPQGVQVDGTLNVEVAHTANPEATFLHWDGSGTGNQGDLSGTTETTKIGNTSYIVTTKDGTPQCVSLEVGDTAGERPPMNGTDMLSGVDFSKARRILPDETINGVLTQHYQFNQSEVQVGGATWTNYVGDIWVAADGGYAVKGTFSGDGGQLALGGQTGHVEWTYDLVEVNTPITISPPAGCEPPAGSDFPKMPDAGDFINMAGVTSYTTASPVADVVAFYQTQLVTLGWTPGTADVTAEQATLIFTKDTQTATLTIASGNGKTTVIIQVK